MVENRENKISVAKDLGRSRIKFVGEINLALQVQSFCGSGKKANGKQIDIYKVKMLLNSKPFFIQTVRR